MTINKCGQILPLICVCVYLCLNDKFSQQKEWCTWIEGKIDELAYIWNDLKVGDEEKRI